MAWFECKTARVRRRRIVGIYSTARLTEAYPGADGERTIVPAGTTFEVERIKQDVGGRDGSTVYLYGKWNGKQIRVPARRCEKVE